MDSETARVAGTVTDRGATLPGEDGGAGSVSSSRQEGFVLAHELLPAWKAPSRPPAHLGNARKIGHGHRAVDGAGA